jgi:hypothetical protein
LPLVNPLQKTRAGVSRSWRTARDGTARTIGWVTGGVGSAPRRIGRGVAGAFRRNGQSTTPATGPPEPDAPKLSLWERTGGARLVRRIQMRPRVAIAWAAGSLLVAVWIGWTVYVWIENGAEAGIGVLISWPAVFGALALISSPFVGAGLLVRRHRLATDGPTGEEPAEDSGAATGSGEDGDTDERGDADEGSAADEDQAEDEPDEPEEADDAGEPEPADDESDEPDEAEAVEARKGSDAD